jgi:glyoxylase-like metal-dependent hydrolase (beta-lactamase superfamily II)
MKSQSVINHTVELVPDLHLLGHPVGPVYLLDSPQPVLFDSGFTALAQAYLDDLATILQGRSPRFLFLTHSHYDHAGCAGWFKKTYPELTLCASSQARSVLHRPKVIRLISKMNREATDSLVKQGMPRVEKTEFLPVEVEKILADGDTVQLADNLSVEVIATPGHTRGCLSYYVPQRKMLFCGEAGGLRLHDGHIATEFLVDYQAYEDSLRRLTGLEVEVLCQAHHSALIGPTAGEFLRESLHKTMEFKEMVLEFLAQDGGDIGRTIRRVKEIDWDPRTGFKQPLRAYMLNLEVRIKLLAKEAGYVISEDN